MDDFDSRTYVVACWHQIFDVFDWVTRRYEQQQRRIHLDHTQKRLSCLSLLPHQSSPMTLTDVSFRIFQKRFFIAERTERSLATSHAVCLVYLSSL
jgi:hypothetical protein